MRLSGEMDNTIDRVFIKDEGDEIKIINITLEEFIIRVIRDRNIIKIRTIIKDIDIKKISGGVFRDHKINKIGSNKATTTSN